MTRTRALVLAELSRYYKSSGTHLFGFLGRDARAQKLAEHCANANDVRTLTSLLDNEVKALTKDEDIKYKEFLKRQQITLSSRLLVNSDESKKTALPRPEAKPIGSQEGSKIATSIELASLSPSPSFYPHHLLQIPIANTVAAVPAHCP